VKRGFPATTVTKAVLDTSELLVAEIVNEAGLGIMLARRVVGGRQTILRLAAARERLAEWIAAMQSLPVAAPR